jgi:spermidine synthase
MLFGWLGDKTGKPLWLLVLTQIAAALIVLGISQLIGNSQLFFAKLIFTFRERFALLSITKAAILFCFMILPTLCLGATFPLVSKIYTQSVSKVGRSIGVAYAINTIGAVLGSFCAGFVLIPLFGKESSLSLVIGAQILTSLVVAGIILSRRRQNLLKLGFLVAPALAGLILCFYFPIWNRQLLSLGKYHRFSKIKTGIKNTGWLEALLRGPEILIRLHRGELVYYGDGIGGFTTVLKYPNPLGEAHYSMINSGKSDASSVEDMKTQTLSAHFPMLFHPNPKTVMVLGLASGVTAGEALYYPIEQLDVLEISEQVVEASDFFRPWNNNVLSNPKTNLIIQDGRAHLQLTGRKYDVITSEPSNPWMAGIATLFTRDFFTLAKNSLNKGGVFCQWVHSYQMDWPAFSLVGRTFACVFPNSVLVVTEPSTVGIDYLLIGFKSNDRLVLDVAKENVIYAQKSANTILSSPELLYRLVVSENLQELFGQGPVNTDNWPRLEFAAPKLMHYDDLVILTNIQSRKWLSAETKSIAERVRKDTDAQIDFAAYALSVNAPFRHMVDLSKTTPSQKERFFKLVEAYCTNETIEFNLLDDKELIKRCISAQIETIENSIDTASDKAVSYYCLADLYHRKGMLNEAMANYSKSLQIKPDNVEAHYNLGFILTSVGRRGEAIMHFTEALRIRPGFAAAHTELGYALAHQGKLNKAMEHFREALRINPDDAKVHGNLGAALAHQGELNEAVEHFREAMRIEPESAEAHSNLGAVLARQDKLDEAVKYYTKALQIKPNFADTHYNFGVVLARQGKFDEAIKHFTEALRIRPDFADARTSLQKTLLLQKSGEKR